MSFISHNGGAINYKGKAWVWKFYNANWHLFSHVIKEGNFPQQPPHWQSTETRPKTNLFLVQDSGILFEAPPPHNPRFWEIGGHLCKAWLDVLPGVKTWRDASRESTRTPEGFMLILRALSSCDFFLRRRLSGQWERCSAAPPPVLILALPLDKEGGGNRLASLPDVIVGGCGDQSEAVGGRRPTAM